MLTIGTMREHQNYAEDVQAIMDFIGLRDERGFRNCLGRFKETISAQPVAERTSSHAALGVGANLSNVVPGPRCRQTYLTLDCSRARNLSGACR